MKPEEFTITCNKCNSSDVSVWAGYDGEISIVCNDCDNEEVR
jgi:Zn finger protein HypA/HybF involved in hydrogenase expression